MHVYKIYELPCGEEREVDKSPDIPRAEYKQPSEVRFKLEGS